MTDVTSYETGDKAVRKFFISYRRSVEADRALASYLEARLKEHGHEVFIDVRMPVGTYWATEIGKRIDWCDHLVVLLSEDSINSEMVQGEVRMAHHAKRDDGRPTILPVRVAYDGPLGYELDSYLSPIQQARWNGEADFERVLKDLLRFVEPGGVQEERATFEHGRTATLDPMRPEPVIDPRAYLAPDAGAARKDDPFYIARTADEIVTATSGSVGHTLLIKASRQMGKSSLLVRYLAGCAEAGKRIIYVDFQGFTDADLDHYPILLQRMAAQFLRALRLEGPDPATITDQQAFLYFIEDHILAKADGPVTFGFDEVDRLLSRDYKYDFFSMLRSWHSNRALPASVWGETDLAMVISTEPTLLIESGDQSPFNVAIPIHLDCLKQGDIAELNRLYGGVLNNQQIGQLYELLAGQPYLTRLAFFRLVGEKRAFDELIMTADHTGGPFGDHLSAKLMLLQQQPRALASYKKLIRDGGQPDSVTYAGLQGAGLACRRETGITPANLLYARYFSQVQ